ncbi:MAG: DUF6152 family protein [Pseudomonadales bacterium]|nr:DUF6152 family protein [Pseudomonadales bacterium]
MNTCSKVASLLAIVTVLAVLPDTGVQAHHSFAMYDLQTTRVFTGVVTRIDPAPNHLQIYFAPMNAERKNVERDAKGEPVIWAVEMGGSAQMARDGVSVNSFPPGTVFSVGLHPLRNGEAAGSREGGLFRCPDKTPPAAGMHCDSVEGHIAIGNAPLPEPVEPRE